MIQKILNNSESSFLHCSEIFNYKILFCIIYLGYLLLWNVCQPSCGDDIRICRRGGDSHPHWWRHRLVLGNSICEASIGWTAIWGQIGQYFENTKSHVNNVIKLFLAPGRAGTVEWRVRGKRDGKCVHARLGQLHSTVARWIHRLQRRLPPPQHLLATGSTNPNHATTTYKIHVISLNYSPTFRYM